MKYWFDTEFIERGQGEAIELISIGIVAEDGRELYLQNLDFNHRVAGPWHRQNVLAQLKDPISYLTRPSMSAYWAQYHEIKQFVARFVDKGDGKAEFWGYYCSYDWVVLCQLFGTMMYLPQGWSKRCNDIKQWCDALDNPKLPSKPTDYEGNHNALVDARWNKKAWEFLYRIQVQRDELNKQILESIGHAEEVIKE